MLQFDGLPTAYLGYAGKGHKVYRKKDNGENTSIPLQSWQQQENIANQGVVEVVHITSPLPAQQTLPPIEPQPLLPIEPQLFPPIERQPPVQNELPKLMHVKLPGE